MTGIKVILNNVNETMRLGRVIARYLKVSEIENSTVLLNGDLGTGKTVFVKGFLSEFKFKSSEVTSPTFILVRRFEVSEKEINIYHIDLYRLNHPGELEGIGLFDILDESGAICLIEWADKMDYKPDDSIELEFIWIDDNIREIEITGPEEMMELIKGSGFVE